MRRRSGLAAKVAAPTTAVAVEKKTAVAEKKKAASKKKMAKHRVADIRRDEKQAKENRAIARATSAVAAQVEAKKGERDRVADEEIRGGQAREQALAQLHKKQPIAAEKRKRTPTSHHVADDGVNDQGPSADSDEDALNSDEEESNNSEGFEGDWSDDDPDGEYGANLLRLQKNRSQRELLKQRAATAKARVSRDGKTMTTNWDTMTSEEKELLVMDEEALAKMRVDG
ncbi:hypothetical protein PInf_008750 [Phytophthora infestans]|nr:hypothetical protein PInf_008750 [Phytophthora infestans]